MPAWSELLKELRLLLSSGLLVAGFGAVVALALTALAPKSREVLPPQRRRAAVWTGPLVTVAFFAFYFLPAYLLPFIDSAALAKWLYGGPVDDKSAAGIASCVVQLLALPLQVAVWRALLAFAGGPPIALDVNPRRLGADFIAAYGSWLVLTPFVYVISLAAAVIYAIAVGHKAEEHPIVQSMQSSVLPASVALLLIAQAIVVAPVKEELFFRGIVQPWLAARPWGGDIGMCLAAVIGVLLHMPRKIAGNELLSLSSALSVAAPALFVLAVWPIYLWIDRSELTRLIPVRDPLARRQIARAVFATSLLFANFHANIWPTPIPLFVLSLGLGWLAVRTQSVAASIILHMLFNAIVFTNLYLQS